MNLRYRITEVTTTGGEQIEFLPAGVTCIVGGNNVGKSQLLRDIDLSLQHREPARLTITDLVLERPRDLNAEMAEAFLMKTGVRIPGDGSSRIFYSPPTGGQQVDATGFVNYATHYGNAIPVIKDFVEWYVSAGGLSGYASGAIGAGDMTTGGHPLMKLFRDGDLEQELSDLSRETFNMPLTLDRVHGNIQLLAGEVQVEVPPLNRPTMEYAEAISSLPTLADQGDGLKSFIGLALNVLADNRQILLIDEPEAFLHPPQARALGRWLARESKKRDIQVIIATHDKDLVLGLVEASDAAVNLVRLSRNGTNNHAHSLASTEVAEVWEDPVLRYSNVLQGLFHRLVVVAESDGDCRLYGAVLDQICSEKGNQFFADEVLFVPSGGKERLATLAGSLSSLGVTTFAIADFDVLKSKRAVHKIVTALRTTWSSEIEASYAAFHDHINSTPEQSTLWANLKKHGTAALSAGEATQEANRLITALARERLLVVPVGEMEGLDRTIGGHGSTWVSAMLAARRHETCVPARELITQLLPESSVPTADLKQD